MEMEERLIAYMEKIELMFVIRKSDEMEER